MPSPNTSAAPWPKNFAERASFSSAGQMACVFAHFLGYSPSQYCKDHTFE
jgi:hypothetical protein